MEIDQCFFQCVAQSCFKSTYDKYPDFLSTIQAGDKDIITFIMFTETRIKPCNKHNIEYVLFIVQHLIMQMTNV